MPELLKIEVKSRDATTKRAARRLRRLEGQIPAIVYGGDADPATVAIEERVLSKVMQDEGFFSQILELKLGRKKQQVIVRDMQRNPASNKVIHVDFMRVSEDREVQMTVPIHFLNEDDCEGVKTQGGLIGRNLRDVVVSCLPKDLPEFLEVDVGDLTIGQSLHLSDLELPEGVTIPILARGDAYDSPIVSVLRSRAALLLAEEEEAAALVEGEEGEEGEPTEAAEESEEDTTESEE